MAALDQNHILVLSPLINPFDRSPTKKLATHLLKGETHNDEFLESIHDGINNHNPQPYYELTVEELNTNRVAEGSKFFPKCYLWVIDDTSIKIILESTPNTKRGEELPNKPFVCHTNITGCKPAYIGGELHFCENGIMYVNFSSDRYGRPETQEKKQMAIQYMRDVGYNAVITPDFF